MGTTSSTILSDLHASRQARAESKVKQTSFYPHLQELIAAIKGEVLLPHQQEEYSNARNRAFNQDQRGYPFLIIRVKDTSDVSIALKFIRKFNFYITCVACGCHSSHCMVDDSIVIDLAHINATSVDVENHLITVGGGAYLKEIDKALQPHNLATPVGTYPETGVGGLALSGGFGWLGRAKGWTADNLVAAEVVLSNGDIIEATENNHRDLLWGLRGGGGNFGIVTKFVFRVYNLPPSILGGNVVYMAPTVKATQQIFQAFDSLFGELPNEVAPSIVFPAGSPVVVTTWFYHGQEENPKKIPSLVKAGKLGGWLTVENSIGKKSYHQEMQTITSPHTNSGYIYQTLCAIGTLDQPLPDDFIKEFIQFVKATPEKGITRAAVIIFGMGGALNSLDPDNQHTCLSSLLRGSRYFAIVEAYFDPALGPTAKENAKKWARHAYTILAKIKGGQLKYAVDEVRGGRGEGSSKNPYGEELEGMTEKAELVRKLGAIKATYDPENYFRENTNIIPVKEESKSSRGE